MIEHDKTCIRTHPTCICLTCKNDNPDCCVDHEIDCPCGSPTCVCEDYVRDFDGGWVSVKTKLPKNDSEVLICTRNKNGSRNIDKGYYACRWVHRGRAEVTHWMPLPSLPTEADG